MQFKIPPQISRLLLLAMLIVVVFLTARAWLVPVSFGQYGWYRGQALQEVMTNTVSFAGRETCESCHDDVVKIKVASRHKGLSCEACHGANAAHAADPGIAPAKISDEYFCLRCHARDLARPEMFPQVNAAEHAGKEFCRACHVAHNPLESPKK